MGSSDITLAPAQLRAGAHTGNTGTAGSCVLMAQSALPCLLLAAPGAATSARVSQLRLLGGTDAPMAPPVDYLLSVLLPLLRTQLGLSEAQLRGECVRRGFYPKGGGEVSLAVEALPRGAALAPLRLARRGALAAVRGVAFAAGSVPAHVAERMAAAARAALQGSGIPDSLITMDARHEPLERALGDGAGIVLVAHTDAGCLLGASALGERGVRAEDVGRRAGEALAATLASGAAVDEHLADQLVIFMALAAGESAVLAPQPLSLHARTAIAVAEQLTSARFEVVPPGAAFEGGEGPGGTVPPGACLLRCVGAGLTPRQDAAQRFSSGCSTTAQTTRSFLTGLRTAL